MNDEKRPTYARVREPDDATLETIGEWVERARRLVTYVREVCPPELPPITVAVSPLERGDAQRHLFP